MEFKNRGWFIICPGPWLHRVIECGHTGITGGWDELRHETSRNLPLTQSGPGPVTLHTWTKSETLDKNYSIICIKLISVLELYDSQQITAAIMGCVFSKPDEKHVNIDHVNRKPLLEQHDVFINNNDHQPQQKPTSTSSTTSQPPPPSRHSPPASRPSSLDSNLHPELDNIESLDSIRNHGVQWKQFKSWLRDQNEGHDSDGESLSLERYAIFLELYSNLDHLEASKASSDQCKTHLLSEI